MPKKSSQFISVGIPTYNSSKYFESCIKSVINKKMINQIIISDDGSTDEELISLKKIISKFENISNKEIMFSKNQKNLGAFYNKLELIKKSKNDLIYILDSDNIAGKNLANPIATILSLSMALRYSLDLDKEADQLDNAVQKVLDDGLRTKDIISKGKKEVTTTDMGDAIISKLK